MTPNADLAKRARETSARAAAGSLDRRAFACASVALVTTTTIAGARRVLSDDCPDFVKAAALAALDQLAQEAPHADSR
jgi:hypothetical protein